MRVLALYSLLSVTALAASIYTVIEWNQPFDGITLPPFWKQLILHKLPFIALINFAFNFVFWCVHYVRHSIFGRIETDEWKLLQRNAGDFLFIRSACVGATVGVQVREITLWISWFTLMLLMRSMLSLARERFDSVTTHTTPGGLLYKKLFSMIGFIFALNAALAYLIWSRALPVVGVSLVLLLTYENFQVAVLSTKVALKYGIFLASLRGGAAIDSRASWMYYCEATGECFVEASTLAHLIHVWSYNGISFTLIDICLFMSFRSALVGLLTRVAAFKNYHRATVEMNTRFPNATDEELRRNNDVCPICREPMLSAKKLPCSHLLHRSCLQAMIEHRRICPMCRQPLIPDSNGAAGGNGANNATTVNFGNNNFMNPDAWAYPGAAYRNQGRLGGGLVFGPRGEVTVAPQRPMSATAAALAAATGVSPVTMAPPSMSAPAPVSLYGHIAHPPRVSPIQTNNNQTSSTSSSISSSSAGTVSTSSGSSGSSSHGNSSDPTTMGVGGLGFPLGGHWPPQDNTSPSSSSTHTPPSSNSSSTPPPSSSSSSTHPPSSTSSSSSRLGGGSTENKTPMALDRNGHTTIIQGESLFRFNSPQWGFLSGWLPSFSLQVVRANVYDADNVPTPTNAAVTATATTSPAASTSSTIASSSSHNVVSSPISSSSLSLSSNSSNISSVTSSVVLGTSAATSNAVLRAADSSSSLLSATSNMASPTNLSSNNSSASSTNNVTSQAVLLSSSTSSMSPHNNIVAMNASSMSTHDDTIAIAGTPHNNNVDMMAMIGSNANNNNNDQLHVPSSSVSTLPSSSSLSMLSSATAASVPSSALATCTTSSSSSNTTSSTIDSVAPSFASADNISSSSNSSLVSLQNSLQDGTDEDAQARRERRFAAIQRRLNNSPPTTSVPSPLS